jgi:hypothetical protein
MKGRFIMPDLKTIPNESLLENGLRLLEQGNYIAADLCFTVLLAEFSGDAAIWLAAGVARLNLCRFESAEAAFKMSAWLSGDSETKRMAADTRQMIMVCQRDTCGVSDW